MRSIVAVLLLTSILISCRAPNELQLEQTYNSMSCYWELNELLLKDSLFQVVKDETLVLNAKGGLMRAKDPDYRLIEPVGLSPFIDLEEWRECYEKIKEFKDFVGVRIVDEDLIIYEVSINVRSTVASQLSQYVMNEVTRLIYNRNNEREINWEKCIYGNEVKVMEEQLSDDWTLLVTQVETIMRLRGS